VFYINENVSQITSGVVLEYFPSYKSPETFLKQVNHWLYMILVQEIRVVGDELKTEDMLYVFGITFEIRAINVFPPWG
jgi:hypothetical protein